MFWSKRSFAGTLKLVRVIQDFDSSEYNTSRFNYTVICFYFRPVVIDKILQMNSLQVLIISYTTLAFLQYLRNLEYQSYLYKSGLLSLSFHELTLWTWVYGLTRKSCITESTHGIFFTTDHFDIFTTVKRDWCFELLWDLAPSRMLKQHGFKGSNIKLTWTIVRI